MKYVLIEEKNFDKIRKETKKNKGKKIIFSSNDDELNRKILEKEPIDILLLKQKNRKDRLKQRNSGFNQVLAKITKKNNISIGIDLDEIISSSKSQVTQAKILARVKQNIKLCNKNKIKMIFISLEKKNKRNPHDLKALELILGMPTWMLENPINL